MMTAANSCRRSPPPPPPACRSMPRRARPTGERLLRRARRLSATSACCTSPTATRSCCRVYFREPSVNLGVGAARGQAAAPGRRSAAQALRHRAAARATRTRSPISISSAAARAYGTIGGFAHLATLVKRLRAARPGALLLDGGDTWQGSATALWTQGQDMIDAQQAARRRHDDRPLGIHLGAERVKEVVDKDFAGHDRFHRAERAGPPTSATRCSRRTRCARSTACRSRSSARHFRTRRSPIRATSCPTGRSASRRRACRRSSTRRARKGAQVVVLLSHNGMDVDLKLASRVTRHRRDPRRPHARRRAAADARRQSRRQDARHQRRQQRQVPRACSTSTCSGGKVADFRYQLLPVFAQPAAGRSRRWRR